MRELLAGKRKQIFMYGAIGLAVVAALTAGVWLRTLRQDKTPQNVTAGVADTLSSETKKAQDLAVRGKTDEAKKYITDELAKSDLTASQKYDLYIQQGVIAQNADKKQEALDSYKLAEAAKPTREVSGLIAEISLALDDKDTAIAYWKKEITQIDRNSPLYEEDKRSLEQRIRDNGGEL
jgi:hypothetical protein